MAFTLSEASIFVCEDVDKIYGGQLDIVDVLLTLTVVVPDKLEEAPRPFPCRAPRDIPSFFF
jgi:hypothetical protein